MEQMIIFDIMTYMLKYQKLNNIKQMCLTNVTYLLNSIHANYPLSNAKAVPCVCCILDESSKTIHTIIHIIIIIDGIIYDPSYECWSFKKTSWYGLTINDVKLKYGDKISNDGYKSILVQLLRFNYYATEINNGTPVITDKGYYNKQADYVESSVWNSGKYNS